MTSSPACWTAYGEVLAREYSDPAYGGLRKLSVDAYAVQHPGSPSAQSIQSVAVHLCRLCLLLEGGRTTEQTHEAMRAIPRIESQFRWLEPPRPRFAVTVADVLGARTPTEHIREVNRWATCCWDAWSEHHATVRRWLSAPLPAGPR